MKMPCASAALRMWNGADWAGDSGGATRLSARPSFPPRRRPYNGPVNAAAYALIVFFLAVLPANIHAARAGATLRGKPATSLWLRIPMQVLFIGVAFWSTR